MENIYFKMMEQKARNYKNISIKVFYLMSNFRKPLS